LQSRIDAEKVSGLESLPKLRPARLWVNNTSNLTLDAGASTCRGQRVRRRGLLDAIQAARSGSCPMLPTSACWSMPSKKPTISGHQSDHRARPEYAVDRGAPENTYTIAIAMHPRASCDRTSGAPRWKLTDDEKPESSASFHRFRLTVEPEKRPQPCWSRNTANQQPVPALERDRQHIKFSSIRR